MAYYVDGVRYEKLHLPCGGTARFDEASGISYRCEDCMAVVGSIGQPEHCKNVAQKYEILARLGSKIKWDYNNGCEVIE